MSHIAWFIRSVAASTAISGTMIAGSNYYLGKIHHKHSPIYQEHVRRRAEKTKERKIPVPAPIPFPTPDEDYPIENW